MIVSSPMVHMYNLPNKHTLQRSAIIAQVKFTHETIAEHVA